MAQGVQGGGCMQHPRPTLWAAVVLVPDHALLVRMPCAQRVLGLVHAVRRLDLVLWALHGGCGPHLAYKLAH